MDKQHLSGSIETNDFYKSLQRSSVNIASKMLEEALADEETFDEFIAEDDAAAAIPQKQVNAVAGTSRVTRDRIGDYSQIVLEISMSLL
jgi:hypothetical protein